MGCLVESLRFSLVTLHCPKPGSSSGSPLTIRGKTVLTGCLVFPHHIHIRVAPCHFCTFLPDQFFLALFCLNIVSWIPCGAFWPNLATSAHFKGLFYPWMDSGVNLGPKFQLKPWANFSNFFGSFCT